MAEPELRFNVIKIVRIYIQQGQNYRILDKFLNFCGIKIVFMINYINDSDIIFFSVGSIDPTCPIVAPPPMKTSIKISFMYEFFFNK